MTARADFWARRKAAVRAEAEAEVKAVQAIEVAKAEVAQADKDDATLLAELDLPDPDTLGPGDDVRRFMEKAVPERLRRRALRRLWRTNPVLANLDGLNDYDTDFTDAAFVTGVVETTYKVGRGLQAHIDALAQPADDAPTDDDLPEAADQDVAAAPEAAPAPAALAETPPHAAATAETNDTDSQTAPAPRRRMRFSYQT